MMCEGEVSIHSWGVHACGGRFGVVLPLGINLDIVGGVMARCQHGYELRGCFKYHGYVGLG
jgi:hypothetical protein